jgi:hypothetical protein
MKTIKRMLFAALLAITTLLGAIGGVVTYQSVITGQTIQASLNRHAEQRLIERTTRDIVLEELNTLHIWLGINSLVVIILIGVLFLIINKNGRFRDR